MSPEDAPAIAEALLATVRKVMIGREIEACEWALDEYMQSDIDREVRSMMRGYSDEENQLSYYEAEALVIRESEELGILQRLQNQFSREIGNWIDARNRARGRRTLAGRRAA